MLIDFKERWRESGRGGGREISMWERSIDQLPLVHVLTRDWTCNLSMCPDQESNPPPFSTQDDAPPNWATQPGQTTLFENAEIIQTLVN